MYKHILDGLVAPCGVFITLVNVSTLLSVIVTVLVIVYYSIRLINYTEDRKKKKLIEDLNIKIKRAELKRLNDEFL